MFATSVGLFLALVSGTGFLLSAAAATRRWNGNVSRRGSRRQSFRYCDFSLSRFAIAAGLLALLLGQANDAIAQGWHNSSWLYRKKITNDCTKVGSTRAPHSNFPVLVSLSPDGNLSSSARSDAYDIPFTSGEGTTEISYERESHSSGTLAAWVQIPSLSASANTDIYMYNGNSGAADQQNRTGTWNSAYKGLWHLSGLSDVTSNPASSENGSSPIGSDEAVESK